MRSIKRLVVLAIVFTFLSCAAVAAAAIVEGGERDDTLFGTKHDDRISGLEGKDDILALEGNDRVDGGPGRDTIWGDGSCVRVDRGTYTCSPRPECPDDGSDGSYCIPDALATFDDRLLGGPGADEIMGQKGDDNIDGEEGRDLLAGGMGDDRIAGGDGQDEIRAGAGDDRVLAADGARDFISCGPGFDRVVADRRDDVGGNCERLTRG